MPARKGAGDLERLLESLPVKVGNPSLVRLALVHPSYAHENPDLEHNQRLEFLGDAVLQLVISDYLYRRYPAGQEGTLHRLRAAVVCEPVLARRASFLHLGNHLLLGKGEEASGGRQRVSLLADAFEALVGALYLDGGLEVARSFVLRELVPELEEVEAGKSPRDNKTMLQEWLQARAPGERVEYRVVEETGPDHDKTFRVEVTVFGRPAGRGTGKSKKEAEQSAAGEALSRLGVTDG